MFLLNFFLSYDFLTLLHFFKYFLALSWPCAFRQSLFKLRCEVKRAYRWAWIDFPTLILQNLPFDLNVFPRRRRYSLSTLSASTTTFELPQFCNHNLSWLLQLSKFLSYVSNAEKSVFITTVALEITFKTFFVKNNIVHIRYKSLK